ncbi:hypothetical protein, partial [Rhodocyclus purpureus]|uniref:hypothetical protein n=1 Tax=Rhodocyclus purpureus TaxID=1067 RepID=UPI001A936D3A
ARSAVAIQFVLQQSGRSGLELSHRHRMQQFETCTPSGSIDHLTRSAVAAEQKLAGAAEGTRLEGAENDAS